MHHHRGQRYPIRHQAARTRYLAESWPGKATFPKTTQAVTLQPLAPLVPCTACKPLPLVHSGLTPYLGRELRKANASSTYMGSRGAGPYLLLDDFEPIGFATLQKSPDAEELTAVLTWWLLPVQGIGTLHPHQRHYQHDIPLNQLNSTGKAKVQTRHPTSSYPGKLGSTERTFRESQGEVDCIVPAGWREDNGG